MEENKDDFVRYQQCIRLFLQNTNYINLLNRIDMKQIIVIFALVLGFALLANAQTAEKKTEKKAAKVELKDHVCTSACTADKHALACGEKGHVCTDACHKKAEKTTPTEKKAHVCTSACTAEKHVASCGEEGHVCTDACTKKK